MRWWNKVLLKKQDAGLKKSPHLALLSIFYGSRKIYGVAGGSFTISKVQADLSG